MTAFKSILAGFFLMILLWVPQGVLEAAMMDLRIELSVPLEKDTWIVVLGPSERMDIFSMRAGAGTTSFPITVDEVGPGRYELGLEYPDMITLGFSLDDNGLVVFEPSEHVLQEGNLITIMP